MGISSTERACIVMGLLFEKFVSIDHLFQSWEEFKRGKRKRKDVQYFGRHLEDNIFQIQQELSSLQYLHAQYDQFYVTDPKQRRISKATVKDRIVHQALYAVLNDILDKKFIFHSLSCRIGKGTHVGIVQLRRMLRKVSANGTRSCYALKMDIRRFFDTVDHQILKNLLRRNIGDEKILTITERIIDGFKIEGSTAGIGIPLGNVTSQLFANLYLHELDRFIKHGLKEKSYLRYCDDFILAANSKSHLEGLIDPIQTFLSENLRLKLHPGKMIIKKLTQGIDFVGYVLFPRHTLVRAKTKKRMKKRLKEAFELYMMGKIEAQSMDQRLQSYLGILSHADQRSLITALKNAYWLRSSDH